MQLIAGKFLALALVSCGVFGVKESRQEIRMNFEWKFSKDNPSDSLFTWNADDAEWETVYLPHTPRIEPLVVNDQWHGIAWYRKYFNVDTSAKDKKYFLKFEGAMQLADVWINEKHKTTHYGGYLPFIIDVTEEIKQGRNLIAVRLDNNANPQIPPGKPLNNLDFWTYGGLYRNVSLIITDRLHITDPVYADQTSKGGILISYDSVTNSQAILGIQTYVKNEYETDKEVIVRYILFDHEDKLITTSESDKVQLPAGTDKLIITRITVNNPLLWHPYHPFLYRLQTSVLENRKITDAVENTVGIREIELKSDGFYINGEKFFINGTNRHQEYPYIGYALSDEAQYRDALKIKNAGFDFVRLSHYPQSEAFLDACDELGLLIMNCLPGWQFMGDEVFRKNSLDDCRTMIRRDRNHPSVIFWEVSLNETLMDSQFMEEANRILDEELSEDALSAGWIDYPAYDLFIPARQHAQPPDYWNYYRNVERPVFIAEYGDWEYYAHNAGFNQLTFNGLQPEERTSRQFRGYGEKRLLQQALNYQEASNSNLKGKSTVGQANWLMFDYNRGYADDIEGSGISDIFRIPKFSYYFFKSQRPPVKLTIEGVESGPMVYIASYWQPHFSTDIRIFSNCDEVALYLNNALVERKKHDEDALSCSLKYPPFTFSLDTFKTGTLRAEGFISGEKVAAHSVATPGIPSALALSVDISNRPISKTGLDCIFIYAELKDKDGNLCPENGYLVEFSVKGNAALIGENPINTEAGVASILLQTNPEMGEVEVRAWEQGIESAVIKIQ